MEIIRENLRELIKEIEAEPQTQFSLRDFQREVPCGTLHCSLGLATTKAHFQAQGLSLDGFGRVRLGGKLFGCPDGHDWSALEALFGPDAFDRLFDERGKGDWDNVLMAEMGEEAPDECVTDQDLALARLRRQLEQLP